MHPSIATLNTPVFEHRAAAREHSRIGEQARKVEDMIALMYVQLTIIVQHSPFSCLISPSQL